MSVSRVVVEADGGSRGNPGPAGYGAVVRDADSGALLAERMASIGVATNNVAEYSGLIAGLTAAAEVGAREVDVRMDSKLVVEQMSGRWQVKSGPLRELAREASALRSRFDAVSFEWIPRARNTAADALANQAMDAAAGIGPKTRTAPSAQPAASAQVAATVPANWAPPGAGATRLILVRHGATQHSPEHRFSGRNELPLSDAGQAQARALAARARRWVDVTAVVSSPLPRAQQTAALIASALGCAVDTVEDLIEIDFGAWEGATFGEARRTHPDELKAWFDDPGASAPGGESFTVAAERAERAREQLMAAYAGTSVVAVTHVTPIKMLVRLALEAPASALFRLHLDTASVSVIDYPSGGGASVRLFNDTAHLTV